MPPPSLLRATPRPKAIFHIIYYVMARVLYLRENRVIGGWRTNVKDPLSHSDSEKIVYYRLKTVNTTD